MTWLNPEGTGSTLVIGRDPGRQEMRLGRPFVGPSGAFLDAALASAGISRSDCTITNVVQTQPTGNVFQRHSSRAIERGLEELQELLNSRQWDRILTLGNEAAYATVPGWPSKGDIRSAKGVQERRGYFWETPRGTVLTAMHPAACLPNRDPSGINAFLFYQDMRRLAEPPDPLHVEVEVVHTTRRALQVVEELQGQTLAADIECPDPETLLCIGFAASNDKAYVFTAAVQRQAAELLEDADTPLIFQNGQFDVYFLQTRLGLEVRGWLHDCMIAWHAAWPEIAGAKMTKGGKRTHKSLAFLASLFANVSWWKDYEWSADEKMYELNGRDCALTWHLMGELLDELEHVQNMGTYLHEMSMLPCLVAIQQRGLLVDEELRRERFESIQTRKEAIDEELVGLVAPLLSERRERLEKPHLMFQWKTCGCCGGGEKKRQRCWSCAGYSKAPTKKMMMPMYRRLMVKYGQDAWMDDPITKAELEEKVLGKCRVCDGAGGAEHFSFNPGSNEQKAGLLYDVLRLPKKYKGGTPTVDEEALKNLLGGLGNVRQS